MRDAIQHAAMTLRYQELSAHGEGNLTEDEWLEWDALRDELLGDHLGERLTRSTERKATAFTPSLSQAETRARKKNANKQARATAKGTLRICEWADDQDFVRQFIS
jgi:hypothetical protein